ncbi:hypothetical protein [Streptomyces sp. NPDC058424]|uniref:hypothetical protein n=1 Tax=Streptomyces sp. NPDC058424 TaxID=3346491 RepID=UPI00365C34C8
MNDLLALLAATTAVRVFLPDIRTGVRRLLRTGARIGVTELLRTQPSRPAAPEGPTAVVSRDEEASHGHP